MLRNIEVLTEFPWVWFTTDEIKSAPKMRWHDEDCKLHSKPPQTAHKQSFVTIHYRWHPFYQKEIETKGSYNWRGGAAYCCRTAQQSWFFVPAWMINKDFCSRLSLVESPACSIDALYALKQLLHKQLTLYAAPNHITPENLTQAGGVYGQTTCSGAADGDVTAISPQSSVGRADASHTAKSD